MNKKYQDMIEALLKIAGEQKKITQTLLDKLQIVTQNLIEILENHDLDDSLELFDYKNYGFRMKGSRLGKWIYLCKLEEFQVKILPTKSCDIGKYFFYHNDCYTEYMSRNDVLTLCEILPEFIENMSLKIQLLTDKEQSFLDKFSNIPSI